MRPFACVAVLALVSSASGCKKGDDTGTTQPAVGLAPSTDSDSGRVVQGPKIVNEVRFKAYVAWDPVAGEIVPPIIDGDPNYRSAFVITLYEDGWDVNNELSYCQVAVTLHGMVADPAAKNEGFAWGLDIPSGAKETDETCTTKGFDVAEFPDGWKVEDFANYQWGLRFYAPLTADLEDWLTPSSPPTDFDITDYTGGGWFSDDAGFTTDPDSNYWYGYALDDLRNVDFDTPLSSLTDMVDANGDMAQGYYVFDQNVFWSAAR